MGTDPVRQRLRPCRLRVGVTGCAENRHEDFCLTDLACRRIDDGDLLARVVDENLVAGDMFLAHRRRKTPLETAIQFTETAVAVTVGVNRPVLLPQNEQRDAGLLELWCQLRPVWLRSKPTASIDAESTGSGKQFVLQRVVREVTRQRPTQSRSRRALQIVLDSGARYSQPVRYLSGARSVSRKTQHVS